jgi:hypothetical protein
LIGPFSIRCITIISSGVSKTEVTQQLDLVPSLLDLLGYSKPFMSFGKSIFEPGERFAYNIMNGQLQVYDRDHIQSLDLKSWNPGVDNLVR